MAQASLRGQEYWRPADPKVARIVEPITSGDMSCWNCGMEYSPVARFCHICGSPREAGPHTATPLPQAARKPATESAFSHLPLPLSSIICFLLGVGCAVGAALMSVLYRTDTLVDWQAVQIWRIEWLLAALAALLAGVLLKRAR